MTAPTIAATMSRRRWQHLRRGGLVAAAAAAATGAGLSDGRDPTGQDATVSASGELTIAERMHIVPAYPEPVAVKQSFVVDTNSGTDLTRVTVDLEGTPGGGLGDGQADSIMLRGTAGADVVTIGATDGLVAVDGLLATVRVVHGEPTLDSVDFVADGSDLRGALWGCRAPVGAVPPSPVPMPAHRSFLTHVFRSAGRRRQRREARLRLGSVEIA